MGRTVGYVAVGLLGLSLAACSGGHHSSSVTSAPTTTIAPAPTTTMGAPGGAVTTAAPSTTAAPAVSAPGVTAAPTPSGTAAPTPSGTAAPTPTVAPAPTTTAPATGMVVVDATASKSHGEILTDTKGFSLYLLTSDAPPKFGCTQGLCTTFWPPLLVPAGTTKVAGGPGVKGKVGTVKRPEGTLQVTYNGWPVYFYQQDSAKGDTNGEGVSSFGGIWYLLSANAATAGATAVKA